MNVPHEVMNTGVAKHSESVPPFAPKPLVTRVTVREIIPWLYALVILAAELLVTLVNVRTGYAASCFCCCWPCWFRRA